MKQPVPYLAFNGNCREALEFYKNCFGGELELMTWGDAPPDACANMGGADIDKSKIMHGCLHDGEFTIMGCDTPSPEPMEGKNISLSIPCDSEGQVDKHFQALSEGGQPMMPPSKTFWNAYFGMLTDKYGIQWMFNCQLGDM